MENSGEEEGNIWDFAQKTLANWINLEADGEPSLSLSARTGQKVCLDSLALKLI